MCLQEENKIGPGFSISQSSDNVGLTIDGVDEHWHGGALISM